MSYSVEQEILLTAVKNETLVKVKTLFNPKYLTESNGDDFGFTLLMAAMERKHKSMVCFLVDNNCRVTRPNERIIIHDTPLHWAVRMGNCDIVSKLLKKGASLHEKGLGQKSVIFEAWKKVSMVVYRLLESIDFHHVSPNNEDDLLHYQIACERVCVKSMEKFVQLGFPVDIYLDVGEEDEKGYRPLHYAIAKGANISIVALLLEKNADANLKSELGVTPLHLACQNGKIDTIQLLLQNKADPNIRNNEGYTSFHLAFYKSQFVTSLMLSKISKCINHIDPRGLSHFHILCTTDSYAAIAYLLRSGAATVGMRVDDDEEVFSGYSALHFAAEFNREHVVELLLQHHANVNYFSRFNHITPLHLACLQNNFKYHELTDLEQLESIQKKIKGNDWTCSKQSQINVIKLLLKHNCNVNARDVYGKSALMYASEICIKNLGFLRQVLYHKTIYNAAVRQLWIIQKEIIEILVLNDADIHVHTLAKESILHLLIKSCHASLELCKFLINKGLKVHSLDNTGSSLLHHAVNMQHQSIVEFLLRHNVDVNIKDHKSSTCLHIIAADNSESPSSKSIIKRLLQANANVESLNGDKQTPLDVAYSSENCHGFSLLLQYGADVNNMNFLEHISRLNGLNIFYHLRLKIMMDLLVTHVRKLCLLRFHVNRFVRVYMKNFSKLNIQYASGSSTEETTESNDISLQCQKELEKMKSIKISPHTTVFNVLHKDSNSVVKYVRNENLKAILTSKSFENDFPQLGFSLKLQFRRGQARKDLLKYSSDSLDFLIGFHLPEMVFDKISRYLENTELRCLYKAGSEKFQKIEQKHKQAKPVAKRQRL